MLILANESGTESELWHASLGWMGRAWCPEPPRLIVVVSCLCDGERGALRGQYGGVKGHNQEGFGVEGRRTLNVNGGECSTAANRCGKDVSSGPVLVGRDPSRQPVVPTGLERAR